MKQQEAHNRLRRVRDEQLAARYSLGRAEAKWDLESGTPTAEFREKVTLGEIRRAAENLERTFVLRLFSEFEGVLFDFWESGLGHDADQSNASQLIDQIGSVQTIGAVYRQGAHEVRKWRNKLVHPRAKPAEPLTVDQCLGKLGRYLSFFPQNW